MIPYRPRTPVGRALERLLAALFALVGPRQRSPRAPPTPAGAPPVVMASGVGAPGAEPPRPVVDPTDPLSVAEAKQKELHWRTRSLEDYELEAHRAP